MPNPYTITITFAQENINNTPDTYDLILTFTVDLNASNQSHTNADKRLEIKNHGSLEWDFDLENSLLMPGDLNLKISDPSNYLSGLLFEVHNDDEGPGDPAERAATRKQFQVEIKINGTTDFLGNAVEDEIDFDHGTFIFSFRASPRIDILNKKAIYDDENLPMDPIGRSSGTSVSISAAVRRSFPNEDEVEITHASSADFNTGVNIVISGVVGMTDLNRPFVVLNEVSNTVTRIDLNTEQNYVSGGTQVHTVLTTHTSIQTLLEEMFQLVDSSITVSSGKLDLSGPKWKLNTASNVATDTITGAVRDTPTSGKVRVTVTSSGGVVASNTVYIRQVVGMTDLNNEFTVDNVSDGTHFDVVLATSQTYTSAGRYQKITQVNWDSNLTISDGVLYDFDTTVNIATIGKLLRNFARDWFCYAGMVHKQKAFFKRLYEYDSGNVQTLGNILEKKTRYRLGVIDYAKVTPPGSGISNIFFDAGVFSDLVNKSFKLTDTLPLFFIDFGPNSASNIKHSGTNVWLAKDTILDGSGQTRWLAHAQLLANLYFDSRGTISKNKEVTFTVTGVGYDVLKSVSESSEGFWVIGLKKNFVTGISILKCIYIKDV